MSYRVEITLTAEGEISKKLESYLIDRLNKRIRKKLESDPKAYGKALRGPLAWVWEFYFEKRWRVLYTVDENRKTVTIIGLKHKDEFR
jgi:mRNA-degrading endonuclease RelE of RelBE toxin-antitoxin system